MSYVLRPFYSRQDGGSPYFGAGCPVKQMWPPRPCTASSSKGEGALATSRGEIGGRLGEATLPCGRDGARPSRCGRNKLRPAGGLILRSARFPPRQRRISARVAFQRDVQNGTDCRCVVGGCWRLDKWGYDLVFSTPNPYRDCFCDQ